MNSQLPQQSIERRKARVSTALLACALVATSLSSGCSRFFWRNQADLDVYDAVAERMNDHRWVVPRVDVSPDTRSRFYSPYDPDYQPLPPDDPAASVYLEQVDGWESYKGWHDFGTAMSVENPQWLSQFGLSATMIDPSTGEYVEPPPPLEELKLDQLIELSLIHSREYQFEIEDLYLAALGLTLDRFQFAVRYLGIGGGEPSIAEDFTVLPRRPGDNLRQSGRFGVSQMLPTGAQWAAELTNNTIWLFSGPGQTNSASLLSFSLVQPLIMGAGRKVVLEGLTQGERELLYATRDLARFRQLFFTDVVGSGGAGYLGLLLQAQGIRNQESNIFRLEQQLTESRAITSLQSARVQIDELPQENRADRRGRPTKNSRTVEWTIDCPGDTGLGRKRESLPDVDWRDVSPAGGDSPECERRPGLPGSCQSNRSANPDDGDDVTGLTA